MDRFTFFDTESLRDKELPARGMGIDLGTTNSLAAIAEYNPGAEVPVRIRCLEVPQLSLSGDSTASVLVPSFVALHEGKTILGEGAKMLRRESRRLKLRQDENIFYDCKNEMGIRKTYPKAPPGFRSASEIGGKILEFICGTASKSQGPHTGKVVVTVPASFQMAQRNDTLKSAAIAGLDLAGGCLLDEPIAAFIDYIECEGIPFGDEEEKNENWMIFDFGGGTCDVAIVNVRMNPSDCWPEISTRAVSRYHRLGGGDIDSAIFYEILVPRIIEQNRLKITTLGYEEKKHLLEPAFIDIAERLKIQMCEMTRKKPGDVAELKVEIPGVFECKLKGRTLRLENPAMTYAEFGNILQPFLNRYVVQHTENEYRTTCSIFGPITDALERAGLDSPQIHKCLMVGGSSFIPEVCMEMGVFFENAEILRHSGIPDVQTCVARGAAYHALALTLFGKPLIRSVCHESISVNTLKGPMKIIPQGSKVPFPGRGWYSELDGLAIPETAGDMNLKIRIEVLAGDGEKRRIIHNEVCEIPPPVEAGDSIGLRYRLDENQMLGIRMVLEKRGDVLLDAKIENPLTHVVNPNKTRLEIEEMEERIRTAPDIGKQEIMDSMVKLANKYGEIGQREKAIGYLKRVIRNGDEPDTGLLNNLALITGQAGDTDGEIRIYKEITSISPSWSTPHFNKALALDRKGLHGEALDSIDCAIRLNPDSAPYKIQRASIMKKMGDPVGYEISLSEGLSGFDNPDKLGEWELGWYIAGLKMADAKEKLKTAETARKNRRNVVMEPVEGGVLPEMRDGIHLYLKNQ